MSEKAVLTGSLRFVSLADVFQILGGNGCTGTLRITSPHVPHKGRIYFYNGNPVNAEFGNLNGIEAVHSLFGWMDGNYVFHEEEIQHIRHSIRQGRMEIVLDAIRMLDDGEIEKIGSSPLIRKDPGIEPPRGKNDPPVIKGPVPDYLYVVRDEFIKAGSEIVKEGSHGKWIWMVYDGIVRVNRQTSGGMLTIARLGEGCFIGTIRALLFGDYERNATVTAEGDVRLCLLDSEPFYREYSKRSPHFRKLLLSLDSRFRRITDKVVNIYEKQPCSASRYEDKKLYLPKGEPTQELFYIRGGKAEVVGHSQKGHLLLAPLERDDFFGNIPFLNFGHEMGGASVLASDDLEVERLDTTSLEDEYDSLSHSFRNLIFSLGDMYFSDNRSCVQPA